MNRTVQIIRFFLFSGFSPGLFLLHVTVWSQVLPFQYYTTKDGLCSNQIEALYQDSRGLLWIGTDNGISIYDGISFRNITSKNGLSNGFVTALIESHQHPGTMWIATIRGGIYKYENDTVSSVYQSNDADSNGITSLIEDCRGTLWFSNPFGIYQLAQGQPKRRVLSFAKVNNVVIFETAGHHVVTAVDDTVSDYPDESTDAHRFVVPGKSKKYITSITQTPDRSLWIAMSDGTLLKYMEDSLAYSVKMQEAGSSYLWPDAQEGCIWGNIRHGIIKIVLRNGLPVQFLSLGIENGLPDPLIGPVFVDREQNLWIGTWSSGLVKLSERNLWKFKNDPNLRTYNTFSAQADANGHLWLIDGPRFVEIYRSQSGVWRQYLHQLPQRPGNELIRNFTSDRSHRLWIGYDNSPMMNAYRVDTTLDGPSRLSRVASFNAGPYLTSAPLAFTVDDHEHVWFSIPNVGVVVADLLTGRELRKFSGQRELLQRDVRLIVQDRTGRMWIGSFYDGLTVLSGATDLQKCSLQHFTTVEGLPDDAIRSIYEDTEGRMCIGTRYGGLAVFQDGTFHIVSMKHGLLSNAIWSIAEDSQRRLWLCTDIGMELVDVRTLSPLPVKHDFIGDRAVTCGEIGGRFFWFLTFGGLSVYEYPRGTPNMLSPPIYLTSVRVNGKEYSPGDGEEVSYDQNNWLIEFVGISFRDERDVRYQYRLEDADPDWLPPTDHHAVSYASLKPGSYRFVVRAINRDGVVSNTPASVAFTIRPPFWLRWWFILAANILVLGFIAIAARRRVQTMRRERNLQREFSRRLIESQEEERKRVAAELHDGLGQNLLLIKNHALFGLDVITDAKQVQEKLSSISSVASQSIGEVREIAHNLRPHLIDNLGITKALRSMARKIGETTSITMDAQVDEIDGLLSGEGEIHLFRIAQEALNNIVKHAMATHVVISIAHRTPAMLSMQVTDDGKGFGSPSGVAGENDRQGFGLAGMRERIQILDGSMDVVSTPGSGTTLSVSIPIHREQHG